MNIFSRGLSALLLVVSVLAAPASAAPYAEFLMDARTGETLRARNAETPLHPASLTKMVTLYIAFEAVRRGEITLDTQVPISRNAARTPYAIGFRAGSTVPLRYLLRAAAVRSSNDGAVAIAEAVSGSVDAFSARMNRTARALGMKSSTFKNPHGLTQKGHMSTAEDMSIMGRRLFYDYPEYYNLFGRRTTNIGIKTVRNTNRRVLDAYEGADGIKTGFTNAAGFNLVASAERGGVRVIATVFGGRSATTRNQRIMELFDLGFQRAPRNVAERRPAAPAYSGLPPAGPAAPARSRRPMMRPGDEGVLVARAEGTATILVAAASPEPRPDAPVLEVVRRAEAGSGIYGITLPRQPSRWEADKLLLRTALQELEALDDALRQVAQVAGGYEPSFVGLSQREAQRACLRLQAREVECRVTFGS
ncbi:D-alanyl-D-alanine carboxypeptidase family protein [Jannaschia sp. W003]|uniref:D-alanyl-D-alanine carboxypeptidase family protein n=1 Tax=Jannaschia sp. W003 TaxID=2867012 RepID=UPI0021A4E894|nr:D-alanyl-D-alanine carboxypeptidase family protein [Jannaschia sp. W003]UWQ21369.1 D-alanyl-D-alanine carboxypeptidase [Jannaschia sp. W003]